MSPQGAAPSDLADRQFQAVRERLARRRRELGVSMSSLARDIGVSPSLISQVERGQTLPSIPTLFALAAALGARLDTLFADPEADADGDTGPRLVRGSARPLIEVRGGIRWERLTPPRPGVEFLELVYPPRAESDAVQYGHAGHELVLVLEGQFEIHVGFECFVVDVGDSLSFSSAIPHRYVNPTDAVARAVTVILAPSANGAGTLRELMLQLG